MLAFSNDYYGMIFRATQSVELFCAYDETKLDNLRSYYYFKYILTELPNFCDEQGNIDSTK